jgi:biopolymer transport protein ExbD
MKKLIITIFVVFFIILISCDKKEQQDFPKFNHSSTLENKDTIHIITEPGYNYEIAVHQDTSIKLERRISPKIQTTSGKIVQIPADRDVAVKFSAPLNNTTDYSGQDTIHIVVHYQGVDEPVFINCAEGTLVPVPCGDETMYFPCVNGYEVICQDTIHYE